MAFFYYRVGIELNTITHLTPKGYLSKNLQNLWPYMRPVYSTNQTGHYPEYTEVFYPTAKEIYGTWRGGGINVTYACKYGEYLQVLKIIPRFAKNNKRRYYMPEIFRFFGFSLLQQGARPASRSRWREWRDGQVRVEWDGVRHCWASRHQGRWLQEDQGAVIDENADIIIAQWNKHFNQ